ENQNMSNLIDMYLFEQQYEAFCEYVREKSGIAFTSFKHNPYTRGEEGYKYYIHLRGTDLLAFQAWKKSDIGTGDIIDATISAIEFDENNLVQWQARFGEAARPHHPLHEARKTGANVKEIESYLWGLFHEDTDKQSFENLTSIFGKKYPIIAYLFFLKDSSKYLPIAPTFFDRSFEYLGVDFKTAYKCSWENYIGFISVISELKALLMGEIASEVTLLDAHSFAWMLSNQMEEDGKLPDVSDYLSMSETERKSLVNARIGQGQFRKWLIEYWSKCAVTGCKNLSLLKASHIKPWADSNNQERLSMYNGILLSPAIDACFDSGLVSFDSNGQILISNKLASEDASSIGITPSMKLCNLEPQHFPFLEYHRTKVFQQ
ncbi:MAG: HNH endonuclease, partial [Bacteroidota bacterium]